MKGKIKNFQLAPYYQRVFFIILSKYSNTLYTLALTPPLPSKVVNLRVASA